MTDSKAEDRPGQDFHPPDDLTPFLIIRKRDDSLTVAAHARDGTIYLGPLRAIPAPPRRRLLECPCCDRSIIWSEWPDGSATLTPLPHGDGDGP